MFKNMNIRSKVLMVPIGMIVILIILSFYAFHLLTANQVFLEKLNTGLLEQNASISRFQTDNLQLLVGLNRLINIASSESDAKKLSDYAKVVLEQTDTVEKAIAKSISDIKAAGIDPA